MMSLEDTFVPEDNESVAGSRTDQFSCQQSVGVLSVLSWSANRGQSILPSLEISDAHQSCRPTGEYPFQLKLSPKLVLEAICSIAETDPKLKSIVHVRKLQSFSARFLDFFIQNSWSSQNLCFLNKKFPVVWFDRTEFTSFPKELCPSLNCRKTASFKSDFDSEEGFEQLFSHLQQQSIKSLFHRYIFFIVKLLKEGSSAMDTIIQQWTMNQLICINEINSASFYEDIKDYDLNDSSVSIYDVIGDGHCAFFSMIVVMHKCGMLSTRDANMLTRSGKDPFDASEFSISERPRIVRLRKELHDYAQEHYLEIKNFFQIFTFLFFKWVR